MKHLAIALLVMAMFVVPVSADTTGEENTDCDIFNESFTAEELEDPCDPGPVPCDEVVDNFMQAETAYAGHVVESSVSAAEVAAWCGNGTILPDITGNISILPDDEDPGIPGKCVSFDMLDSDPGDGVYCVIWCGWKVEHAEYEVSILASTGPTQSAPLIYAGVGCSNSGFYHTLPFGIACGGWDFSCNKADPEGTELQWGSCMFWAGGDHAKIEKANCAWEA